MKKKHGKEEEGACQTGFLVSFRRRRNAVTWGGKCSSPPRLNRGGMEEKGGLW